MPYDRVRWLESEPLLEDLPRGFAAETADPAWMLGRQWQMNEHQGLNASSPVRVEYRASSVPVEPLDGDPRQDPRLTPAEAIVESEPGDYWTPGRRIAAGRRVQAAAPPLPNDPSLLLTGLPAPYDVLDGTGPDGRALWERRVELELAPAWFGETPPDPEPSDQWDPAEFAYSADFRVGGTKLRLRRHDGGTVDWYSVDADGPLSTPVPGPEPVSVLAGRATYPGAPAPRWWQIEDAAVDVGGYPPDRAHVATTLLIDLIASHADGWFGFPVGARAGHVVTLHEVVAHDSFGDAWPLKPPGDGWTLFAVSGLGGRSLLVWSTVATPLQGPVIDEVDVGADEDANVLWAVERRVAGREVETAAHPTPIPPEAASAQDPPAFTYQVSTDIPAGWHPYLISGSAGRRRFVQARTTDLSAPEPVPSPEPVSDLLYGRAAGKPHEIEPAAVPSTGLRLVRRAVLARRTDGTPVLWTQRRTEPLLTPPALRLRWDQFVAAAGPS
ncbi:hypothetical protein [Streptomyces ochraceiscleroticus]|uniref:Uncharacterized protein n=1 Tax=Streptomyces ochraceiscleroticus TaxID=47761 RepID=A0ABW1MM79_9ACTN|nr:hypothetical protein [Streptomyces ochraceiscleroticus]